MAKLLMITGLGSAKDLASGKKSAFYNTLEEFHKHWERIDIIAPKSIINHEQPTRVLFGNAYVHISPWPLTFYPIWFLKKVLEIYKEQKFDLMTVHEFPPFYNGIAARILWQFLKVPYVVEIMHISGYPEAAGLKERVYKVLTKFFIKFDVSKARAVRVINKKETAEFLKKAGVPGNKIIYIPALYIDLDVFKPMSLHKDYDLIFIGRLEKNKGTEFLLKAIKLLTNSYQFPIKCLIVGDGPERKRLEKLASIYKLQNTIFYGWANDLHEIAQLLNKSKILVMPSYNEGGPRVVFESLACGVPALVTPVGMMLDFQSSITVIDWDAQDIADKAKKLLSDPQVYEGMLLRGLEITKQFEKKAAIKNYAEKLQKFINF